MEDQFHEVDWETFDKYVEANTSIKEEDGLNEFYYDKELKLIARHLHGFFTDTFEILGEPNAETLNTVSKIINR